MVVTQKETSTFSSSVSDESSVRSCTFSGKETTRCNSFKVLLNGLVWLGEQIGKFFKFIFERCCSCCATKRNVLVSDAARNSGEKGAIPEPAVSGRPSEWANQETHESQPSFSSAEAMTPSEGVTAEPAASGRLSEWVNQETHESQPSFSSAEAMTPSEGVTAEPATSGQQGEGVNQEAHESQSSFSSAEAMTLSEGVTAEPAASGQQGEGVNQETHESQLFSSSAEAMTLSEGVTAEPAASDRQGEWVNQETHESQPSFSSAEAMTPSEDVTAEPAASGQQGEGVNQETHESQSSFSSAEVMTPSEGVTAEPAASGQQGEGVNQEAQESQPSSLSAGAVNLEKSVSRHHTGLMKTNQSCQAESPGQQIPGADVLPDDHKVNVVNMNSVPLSQIFARMVPQFSFPMGSPVDPGNHTADRTAAPQTSVLPVSPSIVTQNRKSKGLNEKSAHLSLSLKSEIADVAPWSSVDPAGSLPEASSSERGHHIDGSMLSFLQESADSINACENSYEKIAAPCSRIDNLEALLLQWLRELSIDSPEAEWQHFQETVSEQCHLLLIGLEGKERIPANWPSVVFKERDNAILPYQYYARIQQILRIFPACGNEMVGRFMDMEKNDNDLKLERKFRTHLDAICQELDLCQGYLDAFSDNTNPVSFTINAQGSRELELTEEDVEELQRKIGGGIIEQVSQTEKEDVLDSETNLPVLFVEKDLPRNDYYVISDDGQILALTKPEVYVPEKGESSKESREKHDAEFNELNKKKNADVIAHIKRLSPDPLVQRKVCYFLTQDPLLGFLHGIESGLIEPLFGAGFSVSCSEGFRTTFGKDTESNKIKIQYEFHHKNIEIRNLNMTMPGEDGVLMMHDINERWKNPLIKCTISVVIDPEDPDNVTTEGLMMHIAFLAD